MKVFPEVIQQAKGNNCELIPYEIYFVLEIAISGKDGIKIIILHFLKVYHFISIQANYYVKKIIYCMVKQYQSFCVE